MEILLIVCSRGGEAKTDDPHTKNAQVSTGLAQRQTAITILQY